MYIHLPSARQEDALIERHELSYSEDGADTINLQLCGMNTISQKYLTRYFAGIYYPRCDLA